MQALIDVAPYSLSLSLSLSGEMRGLEGGAEAVVGSFNAQDVANTLPYVLEITLLIANTHTAHRRAGFDRRMSFGVFARTDSSVSVPAASERDAAPYGAVGGGRGSLPDIRVLHRHAHTQQRPGDGRGEEQPGGGVGSGV